MLTDKTVILGVTGGIAAYKAADLASKLTQDGARVEVVMTEAATKLVAPLTFRTLTHTKVITDMFTAPIEYGETHISLSEAADAVAIAPATANTIAKIAAGMADNMLTGVVLATRSPYNCTGDEREHVGEPGYAGKRCQAESPWIHNS